MLNNSIFTHNAMKVINIQKYIPKVIILFVKIYFTAIITFFLFRLILFFSENERVNASVKSSDIITSFVIGVRFDLVITGYITIFPYIILSFLSFFKHKFKIVEILFTYYLCILFSFSFVVCAIDIPYFNQFFSRFSIAAFEWIDSPVFILKMIFQEPRYWLIIIPLILFLFVFNKLLYKFFAAFSYDFTFKIHSKIVFFIFFLALILLGIRGRIEEKSPIRTGTAYFSNNAFLNQLGLNPNFTLIRSFIDSRKAENKTVNLMNNDTAINIVQHYLNIKNANTEDCLSRNIVYDSTQQTKNNVVLIIMESMSAAKMARHGNADRLTPFLDSISKHSYYFENAYTAGIHTFNGVFSTFCAFPALFQQHTLKKMHQYNSIFSVLKHKGYSTIYFTTHDGQFDNVEGFLKANDCERIVSKTDYPSDKIMTTLGVSDDYMFEFAIPIVNNLHQKNKPFFAAFMTASDHGPYYIPPYFKPKSKDIKKQIVEYADFSLKKFIDLAAKQKWFANTLFVFVADHGAPIGGLYDMSIDYNHTPLIFYAPEIIKTPKVFDKMAGQIDVFPSIMGLLKCSYTNNTLGIDLFNENRPYIFFNADDKYGVIDNQWFLIVRNDKSMGLYKYRNNDTYNYAEEQQQIAVKMNTYAQANIQTFQYIIQKK